MANSADPDQPAVWSGSAVFAQTSLSENLGSLPYDSFHYISDAILVSWLQIIT